MSGVPTNSYSYLGTQGPESTTFDLHTQMYLIESVLLARLSTATIVKVVRAPYDASGSAITPGSASAIGFVDVQPMVNQIDGYGNATPHGTVYKLSYHRLQGGNGAVIADPAVGDVGKMVIADRDTSVVRATGAQGNPGSRRIFDKADGTYFGSLIASAPTQYLAFTADGIKISDKHGNSIVTGASGITITDCKGNTITMDSTGIVLKVPSGKLVQETAGGTTQFVETTLGTSTVAKADA